MDILVRLSERSCGGGGGGVSNLGDNDDDRRFTKCVMKSSAVDPDPELFVPNPTKMKEQINGKFI